jgi:hypothetical protein
MKIPVEKKRKKVLFSTTVLPLSKQNPPTYSFFSHFFISYIFLSNVFFYKKGWILLLITEPAKMELQLAHATGAASVQSGSARCIAWYRVRTNPRCAKLGQSDRDRSWAGPKPTAAMTVGPSQKGPRSQRAGLVKLYLYLYT